MPQFIREYTGKVDELVKDKIEAAKEVKAKEQEEKDVIAQQVNPSVSVSSSYQFAQWLFSICFCILNCELELQNMYAQLLPLALPAPPMPGMGGGPGMPGFVPGPPQMGGLGMPPMPPFGMPPMGSSY